MTDRIDQSHLVRRLRQDAAELESSDLARASRLVASVVNLLRWAAEELEVQHQELQMVAALSRALDPFIATARCIPDNWPAECVLDFREHEIDERHLGEHAPGCPEDRYRQYLGYLSAACRHPSGPTIGDWRNLVEVTR